MSEADIVRDIRVRIGALPDVALWRNQAGAGLLVSKAELELIKGCIESRNYRRALQMLEHLLKRHFVKGGLITGASDLIGVGPKGRMLAVEVKMPGGTITEEQQLFLDLVEERGGIAVCATSPEDVEEAVNAARENRVYKWREQVRSVRGLRGEGDAAPRRVRKAPK
jgi:hypothetical protein